MKTTLIEFFANYSKYIVLAHVLSAIIWVGGMIVLRFFVHSAIAKIDSSVIKLRVALSYLKSFFNVVIFLIIILLSTAMLMSIGMNLIASPLAIDVHIKEAILTVMIINFIFIYIKRNRAENLYLHHNYEATTKELKLIPNMILLNIILGVCAVYLGVTLRGF